MFFFAVDPCEDVVCDYNAECRALPNDTALCQCVDDCSAEPFKPVCGSDLVTYASECALKGKACKNEMAISVVSEGICREYLKTLLHHFV